MSSLFAIFLNVAGIICANKAMVMFKKSNELFSKSFEQVLAFNDSKYSFKLKNVKFIIKLDTITYKIGTQINWIKLHKPFMSKKHFLKYALLRMINITTLYTKNYFDNLDDQYNFIMKKYINILQNDYKYSIEEINITYNQLLGIDQK
ncbi:hypothetical protein ACJA25_00840 [Mycoplasmopsis hyopharyngis]|uniref:hypothetical protein n=1 Tax=Mycoplasmopsis hyopharyngis TaxID=29558 RepID=UPI003872AF8C